MLIEWFQLNLFRHLFRRFLSVAVIVLLHRVVTECVVSNVILRQKRLDNDVLFIPLLVASHEELTLLQPEARFEVIADENLIVFRNPQKILPEYMMVPFAHWEVNSEWIILELLLRRSLTYADLREDELADVALRMDLHTCIGRLSIEFRQEIILQVWH